MKKLSFFLCLILICSTVFGAFAENAAETVPETSASANRAELLAEYFPSWDPEAPAVNALIDYVEDVTDDSSPNYIPVADRIAIFDMDGTLYGELFPTYLEYYMLAWRILKDPSLEPDEDMLAVGRLLRDCALDNSFPSDMPMQHAVQAARAYAGMTLTEFADFVTRILIRDVDGFEGMTYGNAFYVPMIEVVEFLQEYDFKIYVCSGSDRFICRTLLEGALDIPYEHIIGMDVALEAAGQNGVDNLDYVFSPGDVVVRTDRLLIKNLKMNKVAQIVQEIGRQPVLSFGNSSGDVSMHNFVINDNRYVSAAFMLVADDDERDYGIPEKAAGLRAKWEESGYHVISMKNDFRTIYGEEVVKTGTFHWLEELAEEPEAQPEEAAGNTVQYILYLGTNDKDTNEPVFPPEEAKAKAVEILMHRFGGYTIQEATGGWIGEDGTEYKEFTLVIYVSGVSEEEIHAATDELLEVFHPSSVLIQAINAESEFYAGK